MSSGEFGEGRGEVCLSPSGGRRQRVEVVLGRHQAQQARLARIAAGPLSIWRYADLLPSDRNPAVDLGAGFTPLVRADRLASELGLGELWIKNDTVNYPTLSFKDRVVSVALSRARELGFKVVACASTGNLANSVAANAAAATDG